MAEPVDVAPPVSAETLNLDAVTDVVADAPPRRRLLRRRARQAHPRPAQCHNCGFAAGDHNFCANCGQENRTPRNGLLEITSDAWDEFVKIDSRLVQTAVALVCRPGRLTSDYIAGKRVRYITPFRLYLTISFLFFLLLSNRSMSGLMSSLGPGYMRQTVPDAFNSLKAKFDPGHKHFHVNGIDGLPKTVEAYEAAQAKLPAAQRDSARGRFFVEHVIGLQTRSVGDVLSDLLTTVSRMMFFLLPAYALLLKLLYIRRRRTYVEHFVYALHIHTVYFLALIIYLLMPLPGELTVLSIGLLVYNTVALRRVYNQGYPKTLLKLFLLYSTYNIFFFAATLLAVLVALVY